MKVYLSLMYISRVCLSCKFCFIIYFPPRIETIWPIFSGLLTRSKGMDDSNLSEDPKNVVCRACYAIRKCIHFKAEDSLQIDCLEAHYTSHNCPQSTLSTPDSLP